ncbi:MAG TPA: GNAT family N-acetyltransferase [Puia sp.]|nr:GNAT family N-acetyltransferase [Puia sp.]
MEHFPISNNEQQQQLQVILEGERAWLEYRLHEGVMVLMHTEVPAKLGGRGIGTALAQYAFAFARAHQYPVKVYCPFVQAYLKRHPEQLDIVVRPQ